MTTEEKAKRYDEVVNEIKNLCDILLKEGVINENGVICNNLNRIFPELKETDEERIKKMLIKFFGAGAEKNCSTNGIPDKDILAWLEKQGEQDNNEDEAILHRFSFYSYKDEPNILYLAGLYVNDKYRNKGIGTKILEVADEVSKSLNCHAIRLKTKKDSDAERLYQTHGYNSLAIEGRDKIWLEKQGESVEINPTEFDARLQGTYQTPDEIIEECYQDNADHIIDIVTEQEKPSERSEEEERIRRVIRGWIYTQPTSFFDRISKEKMLAWIEKQDGKINPYTGTSFKYNNHTWGMCARDNGVEILFDGELKAFLSLEKSFIYPVHPQPTIAPKSELETNKEKVEPKYHEGEWVVSPNGVYWHIDAIRDGHYQVSSNLGVINYWSLEANIYHRFIIQDAKEGDVLACNDEILLFKSYSVQGRISLYCWYNGHTNNFHSKEVVDILMTTKNKTCPATKEQRDLLFQKMKEAGYEWDAEKKELKELKKT